VLKTYNQHSVQLGQREARAHIRAVRWRCADILSRAGSSMPADEKAHYLLEAADELREAAALVALADALSEPRTTHKLMWPE